MQAHNREIPSLTLPEDLSRLLHSAWLRQHLGAGRDNHSYAGGLSGNRDTKTSFQGDLDKAVQQFVDEYTLEDEDFVAAVARDWNVLLSPKVVKALRQIGGANNGTDALRLLSTLDFDDVLPNRVNRQRVNRATACLLERIGEIVWPTRLQGASKTTNRVTLPISLGITTDEYTPFVDPYSPYERGLTSMLAIVTGKSAFRQASVLQARLIENVSKARQYGDTPDLKGDRLATIDSLNSLMLREAGTSFLDLCGAVATSDSIVAVVSLRQSVAHNLPQPWYGEFIGRQAELTEIWQTLRPYPASRYHVITIAGIGGVGKTSLALQAAYKYVREHQSITTSERFDAIVWASAKRDVLTPEGVTTTEPRLRNIEDIYNAIADVLQTKAIRAAGSDQGAVCRRLLATNRVLIVVDNLETVDDPAVLTFLKDLPEPSKAIVTSRHRTIGGAVQIRVQGLGEADGLLLVTDEARRKQTPISIAAAAEIASRTEGVPLAIVWTVGQIALGHPVEQVAKRLGSAGGDFAGFVFSDALEFLRREKKLAAVRLLMTLSLFPDGATRAAVGYVAGFESAPDIRDEALADLVRLSLINRDDNGRLSMLALTREYAMVELARHADFREQSAERWYKWYLDLTERAGGGKLDLDASLLGQLNEEHINLLWVAKSSFTHERFDIFVRLLRGLGFYWIGRGYWSEYEEKYEKGRLLAPKPEDRIHFATRLVWLNVLRRNREKAKKMLAYANELLADYPNHYEEMRIEDYTGELNMELGDLENAEIHLRRSYGLAQSLRDRRGQFAALKYLGELYCRRGDPLYARELLKTAEPFASGTSEDKWIRGLAHAFQLRGMIGLVERNWSDASTGFDGCLDYLKIWPDERLGSKAMHGLAFARRQMDEIDTSTELLVKAQDIYESLGMSHLTVAEILDVWGAKDLQGFWDTM